MLDVLRVRYTKWTSLPHWEFEATRLGEDRYGLWLGMPTGTRMARPGMEVRLSCGHVLLVPEAPYTALFSRRQATDERSDPPVVYVDITTTPIHVDGTISAVDLDLDVIRTLGSRVFLDDEDEFRQHQLELGYPPEVVDLATETASRLLTEVADRVEPFGVAAEPWLDLMRA